MVLALQDFVDLERLPFNRDYKGILGNIMAIRKMKRPRYKTRLNPDIGGSAQKYSMVPGRSSADSRGFLWTSEVDPLEQHPIYHLHMWLAVEGIFCYMCVEHAQPAILNDGAGLQGTGSRFAPCLESVGGCPRCLRRTFASTTTPCMASAERCAVHVLRQHSSRR